MSQKRNRSINWDEEEKVILMSKATRVVFIFIISDF